MKILGYEYIIDRSSNADQIGYFGFFNPNKQVIQIANDIETEMQQSVLIHEILEALNFHLELELSHNKITSLESGLYQVLRDNGIDFGLLKD